jgi:hypothetical protein
MKIIKILLINIFNLGLLASCATYSIPPPNLTPYQAHENTVICENYANQMALAYTMSYVSSYEFYRNFNEYKNECYKRLGYIKAK